MFGLQESEHLGEEQSIQKCFLWLKTRLLLTRLAIFKLQVCGGMN